MPTPVPKAGFVSLFIRNFRGKAELLWQGKDGPCALFVWEQGQSAPVEQLVEEKKSIIAIGAVVVLAWHDGGMLCKR